ncbi:hypothetical protein HYY73_00705 [Candidatus Woesearchaeota archaeon]|nr:hypothetical protein [Candidatus Woesearchaeota archaeon]
MVKPDSQRHTAIIAIKTTEGEDLAAVVKAEALKLRRHAGLRHKPLWHSGNYIVLRASRNYALEIVAAQTQEAGVVRLTINSTGTGAMPKHVTDTLRKQGYTPLAKQHVQLDALYRL